MFSKDIEGIITELPNSDKLIKKYRLVRKIYWSIIVVSLIVGTLFNLRSAHADETAPVIHKVGNVTEVSKNQDGTTVSVFLTKGKVFGVLLHTHAEKKGPSEMMAMQKILEKMVEKNKDVKDLDITTLLHADDTSVSELFYVKSQAPPGFSEKTLYQKFLAFEGGSK